MKTRYNDPKTGKMLDTDPNIESKTEKSTKPSKGKTDTKKGK